MRCTSGNAPRGCMGTIRNSQFPSPRQYQSTVHRTDRGHEMNESPVRLSLFERREKSVSAPTELCALGTALCGVRGLACRDFLLGYFNRTPGFRPVLRMYTASVR